MTDPDSATKHYPALVTVEGCGFYQGHTVSFNGQQAYYRPYDGSDFDQVADEAWAAFGALVRERLGHPEEQPGGDPP